MVQPANFILLKSQIAHAIERHSLQVFLKALAEVVAEQAGDNPIEQDFAEALAMLIEGWE